MLEAWSRTRDGTRKLSANFTVAEFACKDGSDPVFVDSSLAALLQKIRDSVEDNAAPQAEPAPVEGKTAEELAQREKEKQEAQQRQEALDKLPQTLEAQKKENEMLRQCLLEMSETVYA